MENVCQFLYKHSLLPESSADGTRVNVTFRAKRPVGLATRPPPPAPPPPLEHDAVFVGLMSAVDDTREQGWKDTLFHPFESPFVNDAPIVAAARYQTWLLA